MKIFNIKSILKTLMLTTIMSFSMINVCFAYGIKTNENNKQTYNYLKEINESPILINSYYWLKKYDKVSNIIYANDLKTDESLKQYANNWLKYNYNLEVDIPIYYSDLNKNYSPKNSTIAGLFHSNKMNDKIIPISIEIESRYKDVDFLAERSLIHELTHMALAMQGKPFYDSDNEFTTECIKNGGVANNGQRGEFTSHLKIYN